VIIAAQQQGACGKNQSTSSKLREQYRSEQEEPQRNQRCAIQSCICKFDTFWLPYVYPCSKHYSQDDLCKKADKQTTRANAYVVNVFPKPCTTIWRANWYMLVYILVHSMFSIGRSFQISAISNLFDPLSALSGQSYGCRISLEHYVQLQPMLVVSRC